MLLLPSDPRKVRRRSSDICGDPEKAPAQKQWPDARRQGERPGSTTYTSWWWAAYECQAYSMPVHRKAKAARCSVPRSSSHWTEEIWHSAKEHPSVVEELLWRIPHVFVDMVAPYHAQELPLIFGDCHWQLQSETSHLWPNCPFPFWYMC